MDADALTLEAARAWVDRLARVGMVVTSERRDGRVVLTADAGRGARDLVRTEPMDGLAEAMAALLSALREAGYAEALDRVEESDGDPVGASAS